MDLAEMAAKLERLNPRIAATAERLAVAIPAVRSRLDREYDRMLADLEPAVKPYRGQAASFPRLPTRGVPRDVVLRQVDDLAARERPRWRDGLASGAVYNGDDDHIAFLNRVYAITSQANPLHADLWPSATKYEAEIVAMSAAMLGGDAAPSDDPTRRVVGSVTSGGTESILLAMRAYRDWARAARRVRRPEVVAPTSAHVAFDKAAQYFRIKLVRVPVGADYRADAEAMRRAITRNTVALVGSAPTFPHGVIDPIEDLAAIARERGIGMHTDACLGGFVLPWARRLGYEVPGFDFAVPGVTSVSADTHKFGYAAKGTSVVLYRGTHLRRFQYFTATDWPGGLYFSPTLAGSRPGALSAVCWAAMVAIGEDGYLEATRRILETGAAIRRGIEAIPHLRVLGDPLWVIAFASDSVDIYRVLERMTRRGWSLNGLHRPPAVHLCVTLRHTQPGVAERFLGDLRASVEEVVAQPAGEEGMAPVYGLAATIPFRGMVRDLLKKYVDLLYRP
ncbi:MAG TPA: aminotransferase class V-fold PLP-dependent enzyme [Actinomycetota bacterium]|jgi:glutamate/tyrosine decarboxylase-like PLP-dependent enzyme|nr:aminotransferase class V-fold PLP-dependent enzyme [Actinomycetota bacterium]